MRKSRKIKIGNLEMGGGEKISVQTMWKSPICNLSHDEIRELGEKIRELSTAGCDILRFAVPDEESAETLCKISKISPIPLVADIHFDYKLALKCIEGGVAKIRINPGNIGSEERVRSVVAAAKNYGVPIRIGVNGGSLDSDLRRKVNNGEMTGAKALCQAALREAALFDELNFFEYGVSMKASSPEETMECNRLFAEQSDAPLHLGVTEAGPLIRGVVQSTYALTSLLKEGIGDTLRISLSDSCLNEVIAGKEILRVCGLRQEGVKIISCPRCGRKGFDVHGFLQRWQPRFEAMTKNITVAIMGCVVNGPGEGKHADIGISGNGDDAVIFKKGTIVWRGSAKDGEEAFFRILDGDF